MLVAAKHLMGKNRIVLINWIDSHTGLRICHSYGKYEHQKGKKFFHNEYIFEVVNI